MCLNSVKFKIMVLYRIVFRKLMKRGLALKNIFLSIIVSLIMAPQICAAGEAVNMDKAIDQRSYRLGGVGSFAEMVSIGVKQLALSAAMSPAAMDELDEDIRRIAREAGIEVYREPDLIVTDLFPADVAKGKHVMLLYKGSTLDEYRALKQKKIELLKDDSYTVEERKEIARRFGQLLSYPAANIESRLK
jgi:hypothetical protein